MVLPSGEVETTNRRLEMAPAMTIRMVLPAGEYETIKK
jgi:hypothetical protein